MFLRFSFVFVVTALLTTGVVTAEPPGFHHVKCDGDYDGHLQGVCTNTAGEIYWSFTTALVRTDSSGKILKSIPVAYHHGDPCFHNGTLFVAVNLGQFNNAKGKADSWVYAYRPDTLEVLAKHNVPEVFHGAGGIGIANGHFFVVGGLPKGVPENYAYEYDAEFNFVKKHVIKSGWTNVGIQSATFHDDAWWFGCYGSPRVMLKTDADFNMIGRFNFDCSLGIVGLAKDHLLYATGSGKDGRFLGELHPARPDAKTGLKTGTK